MISLSSTTRLFRRFRWPGALLGLLAACVSPGFAQSISHIQLITLTPRAPISVRFSILNGQGILPAEAIAPVTLFERVPNSQTVLLDAPRNASDSKRSLVDLVEFSETPFIQQVCMPLGTFFGGRISLGGYNAVTPMEHIERGLPGGGSLDAWSPYPMGHGGMILPKNDNRYGLSLTFYYAGNVEEARGAKLNEIVSWLAARNPW